MRRYLVELVIAYGTRRINCAHDLIAAWRRHAEVELNEQSTDAERREVSAAISNLLAEERELTEKQANAASMLTKEELDYAQGEIGKYHALMFSDAELREAIKKDGA